jgi:hypothetical protein
VTPRKRRVELQRVQSRGQDGHVASFRFGGRITICTSAQLQVEQCRGAAAAAAGCEGCSARLCRRSSMPAATDSE